MAAIAWVPVWVPVSSPRTVWVTGVNGWYSANWRSPSGIVLVGTNPLLSKRQQGEEQRGVASSLNAFGGQAKRGGETHEREREQEQHTGRGQPGERAGRRAVSDREGDAEHDGEADDRLDQAADHMTGQHGAAGDRHGAKPVDDALGHIHGDRQRGAQCGRGHGHDQDAGHDIGEVGGAVAMWMRAEAGAELAAEDVDEQQQEHDRHPDQHQRHRRVAQLVLEVARRSIVAESLTV